MAEWTRELVIHKIQEYCKQGKTINYSAVVVYDEPLTGAARRLFGTWGNAIQEAGFDYMAIKKDAAKNKGKKPRGFWSESLIIDKIKERRESGLSLSPHKVQAEDSSLYAAASSYCKSWGKAVEAAGYDYLEHRKTTEWSPEKVIERIKYAYERGADLSDNTVNVLNPSLYGAAGQYFGGWQQAIEAAGLDHELTRRTMKWSRPKIIEMVKQAAQEGRPLTCNSFPSAAVTTALKYFGTWDNLLDAAGYGEKPWAKADQRIRNHIREYRKEAGLSEVKLGKMLGVSHRTISMIELAQMPDPRVSFAIRLARALGKTVEEIFELGEETRNVNAKIKCTENANEKCATKKSQ